jgi:hypothetical protein
VEGRGDSASAAGNQAVRGAIPGNSHIAAAARS